jgi:hypothetical protein
MLGLRLRSGVVGRSFHVNAQEVLKKLSQLT